MPVREQYLPSLPITRIIVPVRRSGLTSGSTGTPINPAPGEPCRSAPNIGETYDNNQITEVQDTEHNHNDPCRLIARRRFS
jgi:hypothetical protein